MRTPDIWDAGEDTSTEVRYHAHGTRLPLGHNACETCRVLSPLYRLFPICTECQEPCCFDHQVAGSFTDDEQHACVCQSCADEAQVALIARTCDKCGAENVDTREVRTETGPDVYERRCQSCHPRAFQTREAWEGRYEAV